MNSQLNKTAKISSFIILILIEQTMCSSANIGIFPPKISISSSGQIVCSEINLLSSKEVILEGEDRWSLVKSNKVKDYTKNSEDLSIFIEYPKELRVKDKSKLKVCLKGYYRGEYYGVLIYSLKNLGVGVFIELNVTSGEEKVYDNHEKNKNNINEEEDEIINEEEENKDHIIFLLMIITNLFLIVVLLLLSQRASKN